MNNNFGKDFKQLRTSLGLTQEELGKILLISRNTIRNWELEIRTPPLYVQKLLIEKLENLSKSSRLCTH